jgi:zinc protease
VARRAQLFEVWIRPVAPENAQMAMRLALHELRRLVERGLTADEFERTRQYAMKNVFVMTATQGQQLGYALDSAWYGTPEFTAYLRDALSKLTVEQVNAAVKRHLSATDLSVVIVTQDAEGLAEKLVADGVSSIKYDSEKAPALVEEDREVGAAKLAVPRGAVKITPVEEVFAR